MGLIAPLFLAGLITLALPWWLHRRQVPKRDRERFASTRFLAESPHKTQVQMRIQYWALLGLRALLLFIVCLSFARPYLTSAPAAAPAATALHVLALDNSLSMQRGAAIDAARDRASSILDELDSDASVYWVDIGAGGIRIDREPIARAALAERIRRASVGTHRLDYAELMTVVGRFAAENSEQPVTLHLVSDLQQSASPARFADLVPAAPLGLKLYPVAAVGDNARISAVRAGATEIAIDIDGDANAGERSLQVTVADALRADVVLDSPTVSFDNAALALTDADNPVVATLEAADAIALDDVYFAVVDRSPPEDVLLLSAEPDSAAALYFGAAFAADAEFALQVIDESEFSPRVAARAGWLIVDDVFSLSAATVDALRTFVEGGGEALVLASDAAFSAAEWPLPQRELRMGGREGLSRFASITEVASEHPVLGAAAPWSAVRVARYLPVAADDDDRVLLRLDNGDPLLLDAPLGAGRALLLTLGLELEFSDLGQRPAFVSFALDVARALGQRRSIRRQYTVGELLPLTFGGTDSGEVIDPAGERRVASATQSGERIRLDIPGFYEVYTEAGQFMVATNPDPRESDPNTMSEALQNRWTEALPERAVSTTVVNATPAGDSERQPLWPLALAALVVLTIAEQCFANFFIGQAPNGQRFV